MGQFDRVIPVKVESGDQVSVATKRVGGNFKVVPTGEAANTADWVGDKVQGGNPQTEDVSPTLASKDKKKLGRAPKVAQAGEANKQERSRQLAGLKTTTMRLNEKTGEAYDTEEVKPGKAKPPHVIAGTHPAPARKPEGETGELAPMRATTKEEHEADWGVKKAPETFDPPKETSSSSESNINTPLADIDKDPLKTTTMRMQKTYIAKGSKTKPTGSDEKGGYIEEVIELGDEKKKRIPLPQLVRTKTEISKWRQGAGAAGIADAARERKLAGVKSETGSDRWNAEGTEEIVSTGRKPSMPKPRTSAGNVIPAEALNTDWDEAPASRGRGPKTGGAQLLDLNERAETNLPGQTEYQQARSKTKDLLRNTPAKGTLGLNKDAISEHAKSMAVRDFSDENGNIKDIDMAKTSMSPKGYHHTKATVMALAGLKPDQEHLLDAHLGAAKNTHAHQNRLNTAYNHLIERQRFEHTSKPGNGTKYSVERGNIDASEGSKDYFVPKGSSQLTHASLLGSKTELEGSTVGFNGFTASKDAEGNDTYKAIEHPSGKKLHQGYAPYEENHPTLGKIRVFRYNDVKSMGGVHAGDVVENSITAGKTIGQEYRSAEQRRGNAKPSRRGTRAAHADATSSLISQNSAAQVAVHGVPIPKAGTGSIAVGTVGSDARTLRPLKKEEITLKEGVKSSQTEGKFTEVPNASKADIAKASEA